MRRALRVLRHVAALAVFAGAPAAAETIAILDVTAHTVSEAGVIEAADILVEGGKIAAIGADLDPPAGARIIDGTGLVATPGLIAAVSPLGLTEVGFSAEANDATVKSSFGLSAALDVRYAINPDATAIAAARGGGVTRALAAPDFEVDQFAGQAALIRLDGALDPIVKPQAGLFVALGDIGSRLKGGSRAAAWTVLRESLDDAQTWDRNKRMFAISRQRDQRLPLADIRVFAAVLDGVQPLVAYADRIADLRELIRLKAEYQLDVVVLGAAQGWRMADDLAAAQIPVIASPIRNLPASFDALGATQANVARLIAAGVEVAFYDASDPSTQSVKRLRYLAGNAVANGVPYEAALASITATPAKIWGVDDEVGSLEAGKAADIVLWTGDPFEISTRPRLVLIEGEEQSLETRSTLLRRRYQDLDAEGLPFAYRGGEGLGLAGSGPAFQPADEPQADEADAPQRQDEGSETLEPGPPAAETAADAEAEPADDPGAADASATPERQPEPSADAALEGEGDGAAPRTDDAPAPNGDAEPAP